MIKKYFMDAVTLSLYCKSIGKNNTRPKNIRKFSDTTNWENINFPPTGQDYKQFEANNEDIKLNVLELDDNEKIYCIYKSDSDDRQNTVNILLLEKNHYVYVKNLFGIMHHSSSESESESGSNSS